MGYDIRIGNAVPVHSKEDGQLYATWSVEPEAHEDAPTFPNDEMTRNTNSRHPSYSGWDNFCRDADIHSLFYNKEYHDGLFDQHPGCVLLTQDHYTTVAVALENRRRVATLPAGFAGYPEFNTATQKWDPHSDEGKYDATLARLIWLEYWIKWALENCETPAIENS